MPTYPAYVLVTSPPHSNLASPSGNDQHVDIGLGCHGTAVPHRFHDHIISSQQWLLVNTDNMLVKTPDIGAMAQK